MGEYMHIVPFHWYIEIFYQDHASGSLLVEEAGGVITNSLGEPLDFGLGRTLGENFGIVASGKDIHPKVIEAIKQAKEEEAKESGSTATAAL